MTEKISRRKALKAGTAAAFTAAMAPHGSSSAQANSWRPEDSLMRTPADHVTASATDSDICFLSARQMADLIRQKKLSAREVMQRT